MPRKKPFSAKQKKQQLKEKRKRNQEDRLAQDGKDKVVAASDDSDDEESPSSFTNKPAVQKINQQPVTKPGEKFDPNRYRLHFFRENDEDIAKKKQLARKPFRSLPEKSLEVDIEAVYQPGSVLDIPRRPPWNYNMSKSELLAMEEKYFQGYLEKIVSKYSPSELSYFEMNPETWRQLWRVLEMSDVLLLITDIRYPALHFSPALYDLVTKILDKPIILVLNKVDLAPPSLVVAWQHYFIEKFPLVHIVLFTSFPRDAKELRDITEGAGKVKKKRKRGRYLALGPRELYEACKYIVKGQVDLSSWDEKLKVGEGTETEEPESESDEDEHVVLEEQNFDFEDHVRFKDGILTIGCVGYPNVGKSSLLNGIVGKKVVSVSRTPGHTKHFQTIFLTRTVKLCDCPGLVFPSLMDRNLQILAGIYPIAQVRETVSPIRYLAERINVPQALKIKHLEEKEDTEWSATDICDAWAKKRGFVTAKAARLDTYRAANYILRMAVDGRLCLCFRPPGYTENKDFWENHPETIQLSKQQTRLGKLRRAGKGSTDEEEEEEEEDGSQLSEEEEEEEEEEGPATFTSSNPFDLLSAE
ncbi:hypothetical protein ACJMK2_038622 [Sinanodonta woodiana]|uniref:Guanine nucleotide-binding protein-like 1 n=1 Tax=Sinanodonta woodiana TaxID=1069815 RepID=A0ABD3WAE0_SINWO